MRSRAQREKHRNDSGLKDDAFVADVVVDTVAFVDDVAVDVVVDTVAFVVAAVVVGVEASCLRFAVAMTNTLGESTRRSTPCCDGARHAVPLSSSCSVLQLYSSSCSIVQFYSSSCSIVQLYSSSCSSL